MKMTSVGAVVALMVSMGCSSVPGRGGGIGAQCRGDLGANAAAQKVEAFIGSAAEFSAAASDLQNTLRDACRQMGRELGMPDGELGGDGPEGTRALCQRVNARLRSDLGDIRGAAGLRVAVNVVPPSCEVQVDAYASCAAQCDASYTPARADIQCEGGELRGQCSAQCTGRCAVDVSGQCNGTCEGACSGSTSGDGRCDGQCQGRCVVQSQATCNGECRGGCSVEFQEPRCTGTVQPPRVNADCRAACDARLDAQAQCRPGRADLVVTGNVEQNLTEKVSHVRAALAGGFGTILQVRKRAERVARSGVALGRAIGDLPGAARGIGVTAAACATSAVAATSQAVASVNVSVSVSVEVSATASASAN